MSELVTSLLNFWQYQTWAQTGTSQNRTELIAILQPKLKLTRRILSGTPACRKKWHMHLHEVGSIKIIPMKASIPRFVYAALGKVYLNHVRTTGLDSKRR